MLDAETGEVVLDGNGKVVMVPCKVRGRNSKEGKEVPYLFVDRHPECAVVFEWVTREDREKAGRILRGLEEGEMSGEFCPLTLVTLIAQITNCTDD